MLKAEYIDHMGNDLTVVNAARVSFDKESDWEVEHSDVRLLDLRGRYVDTVETGKTLSDSDTRLLDYLARNAHWTPFAHPQITLRMTAPVPIRTQCFKHKVGFTENEVSRRYVDTTPNAFWPDKWREAPEKGGAKQGSAGVLVDQGNWDQLYGYVVEITIDAYEEAIRGGVCPEQARFMLPQGAMVEWYWTGSLAAYARFFKQRTDPHAQHEIQELARQVGDIIQPLFPVSWEKLT